MQNTNYSRLYSEAATTNSASFEEAFKRSRAGANGNDVTQPQAELPENSITRAEVEKLLEAHLSKIEALVTTQEQKVAEIKPSTPEKEVTKETEGFLTRVKEAYNEFNDTLKYLIADATDDVRLKIKNGINGRVLKINSAIKKLGETIDKTFALEEKTPRIDPREAKRQAIELEKERQQEPSVVTKQEPITKEKEHLESTNKEASIENQKEAITINVSKEATVAFDTSIEKPKPTTESTRSEQQYVTPEKQYDFEKIADRTFSKRAENPKHNWLTHQEKFGDQNLSKAWEVFMKDAWNIQPEIAPMIHTELSSTWEKDYYDFFYEGGKEAYDAAMTKGTELNYSLTAIQHFERLYDQEIAKTMQEQLQNEVIGKHSPVAKNKEETIKESSAKPEDKKSEQPLSKFEQRKLAGIEKNKLIERNLSNSPEKQVVNDAPMMK